MSFEDLSALKTKIDLEYKSRPESEGYSFPKGSYLVGRDIKPGVYYVTMIYPDSYEIDVLLAVYKDEKTADLDKNSYTYNLAETFESMSLSEAPIAIELKEGNVLRIARGGVLTLKTENYNPSDYYKFELPEGTLVPKGSYTIGTDIPAGMYRAYAGTVNGGRFSIDTVYIDDAGNTSKKSKKSSTRLFTTTAQEYEILNLEEGDVLEVETDIVMKKQPKLDFGD